jgi:hypothetical protein
MPTSGRPARTYDADRVFDLRLPDHVRARLGHHLEEGHTCVRVIDCAEEGYLLESFRDAHGTVVVNRHAVIWEETDDPA